MKTTKRVCSLLLALLMMVSLLPAPALAEPAPAFTLQPESGSHVPGESYLLTWELNQTPDRLELVREENVILSEEKDLGGDYSSPAAPQNDSGEDEPVLVPVQELEPEATSLELTAPEEETVFHLRAFYGEEELLSEPFTVTEDLPPLEGEVAAEQPEGSASPERGGAEQSEEEPTAPLAGEPADSPVEADAPGGAGDEPAAEQRPDEPQDVYAFVTQPQSGSFDPDTQDYMVSWQTNFVPVKVLVQMQASSDHWQTISTMTMGLQQSLSTTISNAGWSQARVFRILAYYGSGENDYVPSVEFTVSPAGNPTDYAFITQPQDGSYDPATLKYHCTWATSFKPLRVEIRYKNWNTWEDYDSVTSPPASAYYDFPAAYGSLEYYIKAYYGSGTNDYVSSDYFTVTDESLIFVAQPQGGSYDPATLKYHCTWTTSFTPKRVVIRYKPYSDWKDYDEVSGGLSVNGSYDFPAVYGSKEFYIKAYYGSGTNDYVSSDFFTVTDDSLEFLVQPRDGSFDPDSQSYLAAWQTNFTPLRVEILYKSFYFEYFDEITAPQANGSYEFPATSGTKEYRIKAYYGPGTNDYVSSSSFVVSDQPVVTSGDCGFMDASSVHWSYANHTLTLSGNGFTGDFPSMAIVPWDHLRSQITTVVVEEGIQDVGAYTFQDCLNLKTVYLPSTVVKIGDYAFINCPKLADVYWNIGEQGMRDVTWTPSRNPSLAEAAKNFAFIAEGQAGPSLTWKLSNDGVLSFFGSGAMYNWTSSEPAPWYPYRSRITQVRLVKVTTVGDYAFRGCSKLSSASFPSDLTYLGARAFGSCSSLAAVYWAAPNSTNVTEIPEACFSGCTALQSFTIPKKCAVIGQGAFSGCDALTTVSFPEGSALTTVGKRAFYSCDNLKNISLPEGVTSLGDEAFYNCKSLTSFPLPSTLTSLGASCFSGCSGVTGVVTIPAGIEEIPNRCFLGCSGFYKLALSPGTNQIGPYAFYGCSKLTQVDYDGFRVQWEQETTLDSSGNAALRNAHFTWLFRTGTLSGDGVHWSLYGGPGKLEIWGSGATPNWPGTPEAAPWYVYRDYIEIIDVHAGVTKIGAYAFANCASLTTVYLPSSLARIAGAAFFNDLELADVWYSGSLVERQAKLSIDTPNYPLESAQWHYTDIGGPVTGTDLSWLLDEDGTLRIYWDEDSMDQGEMAIPDYNDYRDTPWYQFGDGNGLIFPMITSIQVDELVTGIGDYAFAGLDELTDVQIASSVTRIGEGAFMGCGSLVSVTIPDTVETLGDNIFWGCGNLETATLPAGLTAIPSGTFYACDDLTTVYLPGTLESIETNAFSGCANLTDIYFNGTSAQWAAIELNPGNDPVNSAAIHFMPPEIAVDAVNFPDPAFRAYVAQYIDRDASGYLDDYELQEANVIYASNLGIQSLQGIAFFYNLTHLDVSGNPLGGSLDLTTNTLLQNVNVSNCELNGLELTGLTHLNTLLLSDNDTGMAAPDLSTNLALEVLDCHNCDGMEGLDLSANVHLTDLDCSWNQLESLDLSANTELQQLNCSHNSLTTLDLSENTELRQVFCNNNVLTGLELGQRHYSFITLSCYGNDLSFLDLTGCPRLRDAVLQGTVSVTDQYVEHRIGADYVQSDPDTVLKAASEGIPIDAEHFPDPAFCAYVANELDPNGDLWLTPQELAAVEDIDCSAMGIEDLTGVAWFSRLQTLDCSLNDLTSLSFTGNPLLKELDCSCNEELAALDPSALGRLEVLNCNGCLPLTQLNVSANMRLHELDCRECALTGLTLGQQEDLWYLDCSDNALTVLDLSGCSAALQNLMCSGNALTALDLSACPGLRTLDCWDNELTGLDLSQNQFLIMADCHDNALTVLFLGHQPKMKELYCQHNSLSSLDVMDCPYLLDLVQTTEPISYEDYVYYTKDACEFDLDPDVTLIQDHDGIPIDAEHFPDPAFRAYLHDVPDTDGNWYLNSAELAATDVMYIDGLGIASLQGIHYFTELEELECADNQIAHLDLSANTLLTYLNCDNNPLTELDLSVHAALNYLNCASCQLTSLDLTNCLSLIAADCSRNAQLSQLILPNADCFYSLNCSECALTSLDAVLCTGLTNLDCSRNGLTELILGENENLGNLSCYGNSLQRVDIFGCPILVDLVQNGSFKEEAGVWIWYRPNTSYALRVDPGTVPVVDHDGIPVDEEHFPDPAFRAYVAAKCDTSGNGWLNEAEINAVSSINVSNKGVETLQGIGYFTSLEELVCYDNSLTELDLEGLNLLHYLDASRNPFTTLDLSAYGSLGMVELQGTPSLTSLNVSGLSQLGYLDVSRCGLAELDVTGCPLYYLECEYNPLTSLTLGEKPDLTYLECHHASLTELDISLSPMLADAYLHGTRSDDEDYVSYDSGDAWLAIDEGVSVTATTYVPGDINGDGKVNLIDAQQLMRYVKYHDVTVVESNLDITGDGRVNLIDAQQLMRYIKYHDVVIH